MRPEAIRQLLSKRPFQPFRLFVSDGAIYDVGHPESAYLREGMLHIPLEPSGLAEPRVQRIAVISFIHLTRVEVYLRGAASTP